MADDYVRMSDDGVRSMSGIPPVPDAPLPPQATIIQRIIKTATVLASFIPLIVCATISWIYPGNYEIQYITALCTFLPSWGWYTFSALVWKTVKVFPKFFDFYPALTIGLSAILVFSGQATFYRLWSGVVFTAFIVVVFLASVLVNRPVSLEYAREIKTEEQMRQPHILQLNRALTTALAGLFAILTVEQVIYGLNGAWFNGDSSAQKLANTVYNYVLPALTSVIYMRFMIKFIRRYGNALRAKYGLPSYEEEQAEIKRKEDAAKLMQHGEGATAAGL